MVKKVNGSLASGVVENDNDLETMIRTDMEDLERAKFEREG